MSAITDGLAGLTEVFEEFTNGLTALRSEAGNSGANAITVPVTASPMTWDAPSDGVFVCQGSISDLEYKRNGVETDVALVSSGRPISPQVVTVFKGDSLVITYTTAPTALIFIPR